MIGMCSWESGETSVVSQDCLVAKPLPQKARGEVDPSNPSTRREARGRSA